MKCEMVDNDVLIFHLKILNTDSQTIRQRKKNQIIKPEAGYLSLKKNRTIRLCVQADTPGRVAGTATAATTASTDTCSHRTSQQTPHSKHLPSLLACGTKTILLEHHTHTTDKKRSSINVLTFNDTKTVNLKIRKVCSLVLLAFKFHSKIANTRTCLKTFHISYF